MIQVQIVHGIPYGEILLNISYVDQLEGRLSGIMTSLLTYTRFSLGAE